MSDLNNITATAAIMYREAEIEIVRGALRAVIAHWDEFGPTYGFDEVIDRARAASVINESIGK